jgi:diguanylate cyclase (GGDEF)-like protein
LLFSLARALESCLRATDSTGRMGGDEFLVILPEVAAEEATTVASKIIQVLNHNVARMPTSFRNETKISISIGIADTSDGTFAPTELMASADAALYQAKRVGKNGLHVISKRPLELPLQATGEANHLL